MKRAVRSNKFQKDLASAEDSLATALDTRSIIINMRAVKTLIRLTLSKSAQHMINFQRSQMVIEQGIGNENAMKNSDSDIDKRII